MGTEQINFKFPHEQDDDIEIEIEDTDAVEIDFDNPESHLEDKKTDDDDGDDDGDDVEIYDDTPPEDRNRYVSEPPDDLTDEELKSYKPKARDRIKHATKAYHDERRKAEMAQREQKAAEELARSLLEENKRLKGDNSKSREAMLKQAASVAEQEVTNARKAYKDAHASGDTDALMDAEESLAKARNRLQKVENLKSRALQDPPDELQGDNSKPNQPPTTPKSRQIGPKTQKWLADNPWYGKDAEMSAIALATHKRLADSGVDTSSDEYFSEIDKRVREVFPSKFESGADKPTGKKKSVVAPDTRGQPSKKFKLSQSQARIAKRLGLTPKQYAQQVMLEKGAKS